MRGGAAPDGPCLSLTKTPTHAPFAKKTQGLPVGGRSFFGGDISTSPVCNWDAFESTPDGRACTAHSISIFSSDTNVTYEKRHFSFNMEKRHVNSYFLLSYFVVVLSLGLLPGEEKASSTKMGYVGRRRATIYNLRCTVTVEPSPIIGRQTKTSASDGSEP